MGKDVAGLGASYTEVGDTAKVAERLQSRFTDSVRLSGPAYESLGDRIIENTNKIKEAQGTIGDFVAANTSQITEGNQAFFESQVKNNEELNRGKEMLSGFAAVTDDTIKSVENARQALRDQSQELQNEIASLQDVESQQLRTDLAVQGTVKTLEESNQKLREARAINADAGASWNLVRAAVADAKTELLEEARALEARAAIAADTEAQQMRLTNAYNEGVVSIAEWSNELATAEAAEQGQIDALAGMGATFQTLPSFMEPTIENLKLMAQLCKKEDSMQLPMVMP